MLKLVLQYLIFPGFLFSACVGMIAGWIDRKVSARLQYRVGPPWYQNFVDIMKLFYKETIIPEGAKWTFLLAPAIGLLSAVLVATILGSSLLWPNQSYTGDLIVVLYLLIIPALAMMLGAASSANPLASIGASREMKLILGYELPFILSVSAMVIKSGGNIKIAALLGQPFSFSALLAGIACVFCVQAKLGLAPFDISEADQEIMAGTLIEYSGFPLALFRLTRSILLYTLPLFLVILFWSKDVSALFLIAKYVAILVVIILIKNTNPRVRIDQALRFFWGPVTLLAAVAVGLAIFGK